MCHTLARTCLLVFAALLVVSAARAQSTTRSASGTKTARDRTIRSAQPSMVADPIPQHSSPFLVPDTRDLRVPVMLGGYCVVSLREQQSWQLGSQRNQVTFDGKLYWFASQRERAMFAAAPLRYVPVLAGDCVVTWAEEKKRSPGKPQFGTVHANRLFFFHSATEQNKFQANPDRYADRDRGDGGFCLVSQTDEQRKMPGLPQTTVIVDGLRYQFAGTNQQRKFLVNMTQYGVRRPTLAVGSKTLTSPPPLLTPDSDSTSVTKPDPPSDRATVAKHVKAAMGGYCPVSIRDAGVWIAGTPEYQMEVDGQVFFTAGEAQLERFSEKPYDYLPALGGNCVVTEIDQNKRLPGSIYHASQYEGRLYLFVGSREKSIFKTSPNSYVTADLAAEGKCVVTMIDEGERVDGLSELLVWHRGKRYYFASQSNLIRFQENLERYQIQ